MSLLAMRPKTAAPVSVDVKAEVLRRAAEFTMLPAAALKAMEIGRNPACSVSEYASAVERDVRLVADILSMANSALYASGSPITTLHDAVRRLGLRRCQSLILATCTAGLMRSLPSNQSQRREKLWQHGYMTAMVCRHLNENLRLGFAGEEFTAGLMHDLGRSLLAATVPEKYAAIDVDVSDEGPEILENEQTVLGTDHCEIGAAFAMRSGLPAELVAVIRHHHAPHCAGEHQKLVAMVAVADQMANQLEAYRAGQIPDLPASPILQFMGEGERVQKALRTVTPELAERARSEARQLIA